MEVRLLEGKAFVYDQQIAISLRTDCRLVGTSIGLESSKSATKSRGQLPFILNTNELRLALRRGWIFPVGESGEGAAQLLKANIAPCPNMARIKVSGDQRRDTAGQRDSCLLLQRQLDEDGSSLRLRFSVLNELHSAGFYLTDGSKFGGDLLAYPGDPFLYHAQFVVRVLVEEKEMTPRSFIASAREAHSARKHLLFAFQKESDRDDEQKPISYITVLPVDGFGRANGKRCRV